MEELKAGDLVFLTKAYEDSFKRKNPTSGISIANRLAKLEEIIDWESAKGKKIKQARQESGKWDNLPLEENKYILSIFYPELIGRKNQKGVVERGVPMFQYDPHTKEPLFEKVPDWIFKEILKKCEVFDIQMKTPPL
jgi:hypothetical protein